MPLAPQQVRKLKARLKPQHIRTRETEGRTIAYIEGWHVIAEANRIFGFDGWDRELIDSACVYTRQQGERFNAAYTARIRIRVRAGEHMVTREGSGAGEANASTPGRAHELAMKAAETDATKRALMTFGNPFGLTLYGPAKDTTLAHASRDPIGRINGHATRPVQATTVGDGPADDRGIAPEDDATSAPSDPEDAAAPKKSGLAEQDFQAEPQTELKPDAVSPAKAYAIRPGAVSDNVKPVTDDHTTAESRSDRLAFPAQRLKIDKSALALSEPIRIRDHAHLKFVASQPCLICGRNRAQAHHVRFAQPKAMGRKVSDEYTVPLCSMHHRLLHQTGNEITWWEYQQIDPLPVAAELWRQTRGDQARGQAV